jgi:phosphate transport system ATP-binding protein
MSPNATKVATPTHGLVSVPPKKSGPPVESQPTKIDVEKMSFFYGQTRALFDISVKLPARLVTAFIGPSGCGKSTFLRTLNRMNDIIPGARATGKIMIDGKDIYGSGVDPVALRRDVGMVFQKSNPFPKSIYDNIAYGIRLNKMAARRAEMDAIVEENPRSS